MMNQNPVFVAIERCCKECTSEPKVESFVCLKNIINGATCEILEPIQKYIRFPLYHVLNTPSQTSEALLIEVFYCLIGLLDKKIVFRTFDEFAEVYISIFVVIDDNLRSQNGQKLSSEDLKSVAVETIYELLKSTPNNVLDECFGHEVFGRAIANSVGVLLRIVKDEKSKSLKISGLKTLGLMIKRAKSSDGGNNEEIAKKRSQLFSSFFPGITISIMSLIISDDKHPQALITAALETLGLAIQITFPQVSSGSDHDSSSPVNYETASKLKVALSRIISALISHTSFRVRMALINFSDDILFKCDLTLTSQVAETIIDVPLTYSCDSDVEVSSKASSSLSLIFKSCHILTSIQEVIVTKLFLTCNTLRQNIDSLSSEEMLKQLKILTGIFKSLQRYDEVFLQIPKNRNDIMKTLVLISRFKQNSSTLVDETLKQDVSPFQFQYLKSSEEVECFKGLVRSVSGSCNKQMLVDFVICNLKETKFNEQFAFISLEILKNCDNQIPDDLLELAKMCIEEEVVKYPIVTPRLRLAIEAVEVFTFKLKSEEKSQVLPILYSILKIEPKIVYSRRVSKNLGFNSEDDMICKNLSYFCDKFVEEINTCHLTSNSLVLFRNLIGASIEFDNKRMFEVFEKSVDAILQILDLNYNKSPEILLQMLLSITDSVSKLFPSRRGNNEHPVERKSEPFCFRKSWSQYMQTVIILESTNHLDEGGDVMSDMTGSGNYHISDPERDEDPSLEKSEVPVHVKIIKQILERSANLLTLPETDHRLLALDITSKCVEALGGHENDLLPLVHKMWSSLIRRLSDEVPVANSAFNLILKLSNICGDFVYRRVNADIFPKIIPFLRNHVTDGIKSRTRHPFTLTYHLQLSALTGIGTLAVGIDAQGKSLWTLVNVLLPYTSKCQPPAMMKAAQESLSRLQSLDPDSVWFYSKSFIKSSSCDLDEKLLNELLHE